MSIVAHTLLFGEKCKPIFEVVNMMFNAVWFQLHSASQTPIDIPLTTKLYLHNYPFVAIVGIHPRYYNNCSEE